MARKNNVSFTGKTYRIFLLLFIVTASVGIFNQYRKNNQLKKLELEYINKIEQVKKENKELENELLYYDSDIYIEKIAREQLGLVKSNEILFFNRATE